ncbi:MAG TPA: AAA family ATPase [Stellaceae bacterium]|nr:AAA family ATPase [Stellaceae bacterium]
MRRLAANEIGFPDFTIAATPPAPAEVFDLDSHRRAREALDFGLSVAGVGFNIFVVGEDRAARMSATLAYLNEALALRPPLNDWLYLNNFRHPANPTPHRLPAGMGRRFHDRIAEIIARLRESLRAAFGSDSYQARFLALREAAQAAIATDAATLRATARAHGLDLVDTPEGGVRLAPAEGTASPLALDQAAEADLAAAFQHMQRDAVTVRARLANQVEELNRDTVDQVASPMLELLQSEFSGFGGLARWLTELRVDILDDPSRFRPTAEGEPALEPPERRYAVNLLVDHGEESHPAVVVESNPTYENLFGCIAYRQAQGTVETDFTLVRAGALHRANGGILVLRAEALAANPASWSFLKAALRDREIRIEEPQRAATTPIAGAPQPRPIPLDVKVVIVGAPRWYAMFFGGDPDFNVYFKIKADIDVDMEASPHNLSVYAGLVGDAARAQGLDGASAAAVRRLLGIAARWAERCDRLTARIELVEDLVTEVAVRAVHAKERTLGEDAVREGYEARRRRNARLEDRMLRSIVENEVMIATTGAAIGQINALTVLDVGDWRFGMPARVSARASVGRAGVVNIERDVALGGPIQQKGAMVLQGFLAGCFAQILPLSFTCSITFEQSYGGVEGDSASLAELIAVLSDLARVPVRQDLAITGSVNQAGLAQAIGGALDKVEGFFRVCAARPGGLTGTQGVIVPEANRAHLVLEDAVAGAVAAGSFHVYTVETVAEAAELLLGMPAGTADESGNYPPDSVFGRVAARLAAFDRILAQRVNASMK